MKQEIAALSQVLFEKKAYNITKFLIETGAGHYSTQPVIQYVRKDQL